MTIILLRGDPAAVAAQWWTALHGYVMLELSEFITVVDDPEQQILWPMLGNLLASLMVEPKPPWGSN